jgi:RNA polymerase sigma factor (sigma-70 family)
MATAMTTQMGLGPARTARAHTAEERNTTTLLDRAAQGDQVAWTGLIEKYDRLVRSVARSFRLQAADVHDVSQTTWLRLVQHLDTIRDPERLPAWLAVTATRESLSILRQASRNHPMPMTEETPDATVDLEESVVNRDAAADLWDAVAGLPLRQRHLLIVLFREELRSYQEVAVRCGMPIGSIGPTRARALSRLRSKLADRGRGPVGF